MSLTITNPHWVQAVTFNANTGRCNVHLRDNNEGGTKEIVYTSADLAVQAGIMQMALYAFASHLPVSISWDGEAISGDPTHETARVLVRITVEALDDPIDWSTPREG